MIKKLSCVVMVLCFIFSTLVLASVFAQNQATTIQRSEEEIQREERMRKRIETKRKAPVIEEEEKEAAEEGGPQEKALVTKINVTGATIISKKDIDAVTAQYENKQLTLKEMQKAADLITDMYRKKGYATSRAYLPPQKIQGGILEIKVVEGKMGNIEVKGNKWFSTKLIKGKIRLEKGEIFDYDALRRGLSKINQKPDRNAKAILTPGKEPGQTDVLLEVKDRIPLHAGFDYDNFGSRYIGYNRYAINASDTNLTGLDDTLSAQYMFAPDDRYQIVSGTYQIPLLYDTLKLGAFMASSRIKLGKEFKDLGVTGKGQYWSLFATQTLIDTDMATLNLSGGFDYKDVYNYQLGTKTSVDKMRVLKWGIDLDISDDWWRGGRTIVTNEMDFGLPEFIGGLKDVDSRASRVGSGGGFFKDVLNLIRVQNLPLDATLLWRTQAQFASDIVTATEQFQIGGIANVRGYPAAENVGDSGFAMTWELGIPPYFIPKNAEIPYLKTRIYDTIRFVGFYDLGYVTLRNPQVGEDRTKTLSSLGIGFRFNLPQYTSVRVEAAWPLGTKSSDGHNVQLLLSASARF